MYSLLIFTISSWIVFAAGSLHVNTDNTTVTRYMDEEVLLTCTPDFRLAVGWQYLAHGAKYRSTVSLNSDLAEVYAKNERYSLKIDRTTRRYDLLITKLQMHDAGIYYCLERIVNLIIIKPQRHLLVVPSNTVASVGQQVQFHCSTSHQHPVFWQRVVRETGKVLELFVGSVEALASSGKYDMIANVTTGQYDLVIHDVQTSDAGTYVCVDDSGFGRQESVELIILVSMLSCESNANKDGVITQNDCGLEPDYVIFSCGARFVGNSAPTLQWKRYNPEINESAIISTGTLQVLNSTVTSELSFQAESRLIANSIYTCEINETMVVNMRCEIPQIKTLYFSNSTQILHTKFVSEESSLTCLADTSQNCSYYWKTPENPDFTVLGSPQLLLSDDQFDCGQYQCFVKCTLKGNVCTFNSALITIPCKKDLTPGFRNIEVYTCLGVIALLILIILALVAMLIFCNGDRAYRFIQSFQNDRLSETQLVEEEELLRGEKVDYRSVYMSWLGEIKGTRKEEEVRGLTVLETNIYIVRLNKKEIEVYGSNDFQHKSDIKVKSLTTVRDMTSCSANNCLYVSDEDNNTIHKIVLPDVNKIQGSHKYVLITWSLDDVPESLSVTDGKLFVTCLAVKKIMIYDTNGNCCQVLNLHESIYDPWHSIQLRKGVIVISHGRNKEVKDSWDCICTVDMSGKKVIKRYEGINNRINRPSRIAATCTDFIFVGDYHNSQIRLLDPNLNIVRFSSAVKNLKTPTRVCLDEKLYRLYVAIDNETSDVFIIDLFNKDVKHETE